MFLSTPGKCVVVVQGRSKYKNILKIKFCWDLTHEVTIRGPAVLCSCYFVQQWIFFFSLYVLKPVSHCQGLCQSNICSLCCLTFCKGQRTLERSGRSSWEADVCVKFLMWPLSQRLCVPLCREKGLKVQLCLCLWGNWAIVLTLSKFKCWALGLL